ncbi:hypothetical protein [Sediminibacterium sp.]|uniref:hypothetical protein n=1 Tax=Sediminibacterium sp. TaxID=1917865 RepID=UPI003F71B6C7
MEFFYNAYGLSINSEIFFPEFIPSLSKVHNVQITIGNVPTELSGENVVRHVNLSITRTEYLLDIKDIATYYVFGGKQIIVYIYPNAEMDCVRLFLINNAFSAILYQRGVFPLHASAFIDDGKAVLFMGPSGAGKSSLLEAFRRSGKKILSDDVCVLQKSVENSIPIVASSFPRIKLWQQSFRQFDWELPDSAFRIRKELPKYYIDTINEFINEIMPIKAIFLLEFHAINEGKVEVKKLTELSSLKKIMDNLYRPLQFSTMGEKKTFFELLTVLSQSVPTYLLSRNKLENSLKDSMSLVKETINKI